MFFRFNGTRMALVVLCALCTLSMLGCGVSQDDFDKVSQQKDQLQQELTDLKTKCEAQSKDAEAVSAELETVKQNNSNLEAANKSLAERVNACKKLLQEKAPDVDLQTLDTKPAEPGKYQEYEVKEGDSLWSIARANNTTVDALKAANGMEDIKIKLGQKLKLPVQGD